MTKYYSQWQQDKILNERFFKNKPGFFVDIGAHDGVSLSNTLFFERNGWTGIAVEPNPEVFEKLKENRKCVCIRGCAFDEGTLNDPVYVPFSKMTGYTEMLSGITSDYHPKHVIRMLIELRMTGNEKTTLNVKAFTLSSVFATLNIKKINYLTVDTEGSERRVLNGIDFRAVDIDVIDVEDNYQDTKEIFRLLEANNFEYVDRIGGDIVFKKKDFVEL